MENKLPPDMENELAANDGFLEGENFVLMSMEVYREAIGAMSDDRLNASLTKIDAAIEDVEQGRTRPLTDAVSELGKNV